MMIRRASPLALSFGPNFGRRECLSSLSSKTYARIRGEEFVKLSSSIISEPHKRIYGRLTWNHDQAQSYRTTRQCKVNVESRQKASDNDDGNNKNGSSNSDGANEFTELLHFGLDVIVFISMYYTISQYGFSLTTCIGPSMEPTFNTSGDLVLVDKFSYTILGKRYEKGDVVIAICPYDNDKTVCKRIAATEGETITSEYKGRQFKTCIPDGHVWLLGDNSLNSTDSRYYGHVPEGLLRGRVILKLSNPFGQVIGKTIPLQKSETEKSKTLDKEIGSVPIMRFFGNEIHTQMKPANNVTNSSSDKIDDNNRNTEN